LSQSIVLRGAQRFVANTRLQSSCASGRASVKGLLTTMPTISTWTLKIVTKGTHGMRDHYSCQVCDASGCCSQARPCPCTSRWLHQGLHVEHLQIGVEVVSVYVYNTHTNMSEYFEGTWTDIRCRLNKRVSRVLYVQEWLRFGLAEYSNNV
jgi:hypothetical protein